MSTPSSVSGGRGPSADRAAERAPARSKRSRARLISGEKAHAPGHRADGERAPGHRFRRERSARRATDMIRCSDEADGYAAARGAVRARPDGARPDERGLVRPAELLEQPRVHLCEMMQRERDTNSNNSWFGLVWFGLI